MSVCNGTERLMCVWRCRCGVFVVIGINLGFQGDAGVLIGNV